MKVATRSNTTLIQGEVESVEMTLSKKGIVAATKMFRDQIYTHKIWAVVREIISNAIDEHEKHGIKKNVEISVPTDSDPHFRVRDFGNGLSKDDVFSVFFQYFESTKDKSNDAIGGFGIGAKSPLAYADMFFVTSYFGGEKVSYVANIDGEASTAHKMEMSASDETGIEVAVPVHASDFTKFEAHLVEFTNWNKTPLTFVNRKNVELGLNADTFNFECELGKVGRYSTLFDSDIAVVIKGVRYPVDESSEIVNPFAFPVILNVDADLGLGIHPSRERLELSKFNIQKINQLLIDLQDKALANVKKAFSELTTAREAFAIQSLAGIFKNTNTVRKHVPLSDVKSLNVRTNKCYHIGWTEHGHTRTAVNRMVRYDSNVSFKPEGKVSGQKWNIMQNVNVDNGAILIVPDRGIVLHKIIAFCEKKGIKDSVFCIKRAAEDVPEGWVKDSDFWVYDETQMTKDEIKKVRSRYHTPLSSGGSSSKGTIDVMGYKANTRNSDNALTLEKLESMEGEYVLIPFESGIQKQAVGRIFESVTGKVPIFFYKSSLKLWEESDLDYEMYNERKFFKGCFKMLSENRKAMSSIPAEFFNCDSKGREISANNQWKMDRIIEAFPSLRSRGHTLKKVKVKRAEKKFAMLPELEKDLAFLYDRASWNFNIDNHPALKQELSEVASKVFA